jgi:hypothetical protein
MKTFFVSVLFVLVACGGRELVADCHGQTFCESPDDHREYGGQCCTIAYPYCGVVGTNCPPGECCSSKPR